MEHHDEPGVVSAMEKLETLYQKLDEPEKKVISELVRFALIRAAEQFVGIDAAKAGPVPLFVHGLRPAVAGTLVRSLKLPGSLVAYSPGCASRGLLELAQTLPEKPSANLGGPR